VRPHTRLGRGAPLTRLYGAAQIARAVKLNWPVAPTGWKKLTVAVLVAGLIERLMGYGRRTLVLEFAVKSTPIIRVPGLHVAIAVCVAPAVGFVSCTVVPATCVIVVTPVGPVGPVAPLGPVAPVAPTGPWMPWGP
jgi:hypothetical protein